MGLGIAVHPRLADDGKRLYALDVVWQVRRTRIREGVWGRGLAIAADHGFILEAFSGSWAVLRDLGAALGRS